MKIKIKIILLINRNKRKNEIVKILIIDQETLFKKMQKKHKFKNIKLALHNEVKKKMKKIVDALFKLKLSEFCKRSII